ncbi:MAG: malectin domain-containing carbohydrate-binding protein [Thermoguttaceae bacterium]
MQCPLGALVLAGALFGPVCVAADDAKPARKYFAHPVAEDRNGVIAPWYRGQNGQCDFRIRIAAETLKRYPWADKGLAVMPAPHFVFNGHWGIKPDGTILVNPKLSDWDNGDVGQRSVSLLQGLVDYYRYTGDPAAIGLVTLTADYLLDYCQTPADHPWPAFPISAPTKGKAYGRADPHGFIQLDLSAQLGSAMLAAYKLTGNRRYENAVRHWADLLAAHCDFRPGVPPWNRYANPEDVKWDTRQTGGVSLILQFLDDMIRSGYEGKDGAWVEARDAGEKYLRDVLLPAWGRDPTFGRNFWDWENATDTCAVPCYTADYMLGRREAFPNWKTDVRNLITLFFCRSSVDPASAGGVYSGAWAFPESSSCCGKSLQYPIMASSATLARYAVLADDAWAREIARRQCLLATYDAHENGVVEDGIGGGAVVAGDWFNLAHPWPLRAVLRAMAWQPDLLGANRENHIMRTTSVVTMVWYRASGIEYYTSDAREPSEDVLRLAFEPRWVHADNGPLPKRQDLSQNGFTVKPLPGGDCILTVRHDRCPYVRVEGNDPQRMASRARVEYKGAWREDPGEFEGPSGFHFTSEAGARAAMAFDGNQVRVIGTVGAGGGKADVYLDGVKQLCGIDFWCPQSRYDQVLWYKNGLAPGKHRLEIVALGTKNPCSSDTYVSLSGAQWSAAQGESGFGEGGGPGDAQRVIFGYLGRKDYVDSTGSAWRPATEFTLRLKPLADLVPLAFWSEPRGKDAAGTPDPELYRYGVHGRDFTAYFTVLPTQTYHVRLKFCQTEQPARPGGYATSIDILGEHVVGDMDIAATAGGLGKAVDLVLNDIRPKNGVISIRLWNRFSGDAMIQAIEVGPGVSPAGAKPVQVRLPAAKGQ